MKNLGARIGILLVFGAVCALAFALIPNSADRTAPPNTGPEPDRISQNNEPLKNDVFEPARSGRKSIAPASTSGESELPPANVPGLEDIFLSTETDERDEIDNRQIAILLRDHVETNHPDLSLSDEDFGMLADSIRTYREAKVKMNSMERTGTNSAALRAALQDISSATESFTQIVGMSLGEFFMTEDAPVRFGQDGRADGENEIVTEYLSDHKP